MLVWGAMMIAGSDAIPSDEASFFFEAFTRAMWEVQQTWCSVCMKTCQGRDAAAQSGDTVVLQILESIPADVSGSRCSIWCTGTLHALLTDQIDESAIEMESNALRGLVAAHTTPVDDRAQYIRLFRQWIALAKRQAFASVRFYGCGPEEGRKRRWSSPSPSPASAEALPEPASQQEAASQEASSLRTPLPANDPPTNEPPAQKASSQRARAGIDGSTIRTVLHPLVLHATNDVRRLGVSVDEGGRMRMSMSMRAAFRPPVEASSSAPQTTKRQKAATVRTGHSLASLFSWTTRAAQRATRALGQMEHKASSTVRLGESGLESFVKTHPVVER
ncbi:MAG: hypothetical protein M1826_006072 [Phylliscum demangeonii]|nr:MAG: hypothetical protein M1826_006072 [Phylliscum demangeonii]